MKRPAKLLFVLILTALLLVLLATAALAGKSSPTVSYTPNTDPDLDCPYATDGHIAHEGNTYNGTLTTEAGTVTFSAPSP